MPPGRVRAFVSHVYQEVYDAACAARRPYLDVLVLLPREAVSNARGHDSLSALVPESSMTNAAFSDGAPGRDSVTDSQSSKRSKRSWVTKEDVERDPGLQVILSDVFQDYYAANLNAERIRAGSPRVATFSLKDIASKAYRSDYFYAEDATMDIPTFANVRLVCLTWGRPWNLASRTAWVPAAEHEIPFSLSTTSFWLAVLGDA